MAAELPSARPLPDRVPAPPAQRQEGMPSMEPRTAATHDPDPDAMEFVRFCYRRRRVGWPELYDEMCAVAGRGLFRGYGSDDLATHGIGFGLFDMPALAALAARIIAEEQALRRPVTVVLAEPPPTTPDVPTAPAVPATPAPSADARPDDSTIRFAPVPAGA
jgi:hypothetical protein